MTGAGKDCDDAAIIAALFPEVKHVRIYLARKIAITDQPDIFGLAETVLTITPDMHAAAAGGALLPPRSVP